jgi:hypothetical protein
MKKDNPERGWGGTTRRTVLCAFMLAGLICVSAVGASVNVWRILVEPEGEIIGNQTPVVVTAYMDIYSEDTFTFSQDNTLRMWTDLEDAVWFPVLSYDGRPTDLPVRQSRSITLSSWDLAYPSGHNEVLKVMVKGWAPGVGSDMSKILIRVAEESPHGIVNNSETNKAAKVLYRPGATREEILEVPAGALEVSTDPSGAHIFLDGTERGVTPATLERVPAGHCTLNLSLPGYHEALLSVSVLDRQTVKVFAHLVPGTEITTGVLVVESNPSSATVVLDGEKKGITPITLDSLPDGIHSLHLDLTGYQSFDRQVQVTAGTFTTQSIQLAHDRSTGQSSGEPPASNKSQGPASMVISSSPMGADVVLDGEFMGITPLRLGPLEPGEYSLKLSFPFFADHEERITLSAGKQEEIVYAFSLTDLRLPGVDAITGLLSGLEIGLPTLPWDKGKEIDGVKTDREKAYEDLMKQIGDGEG